MWIDFQNSSTRSRWFVGKFSMYTSQRFPPQLQYVATLWKSKIQKMLPTLTAPQQSVDMFLRTLWGRLKTAHTDWLTDWLTLWSLSDDVSNEQLNLIQLSIVASWRISPWLGLSSHRLCYLSAILCMLYTYWSKIISAIFLGMWHKISH